MKNIFQGSQSILKAIAESWGYPPPMSYGWFTEDMYHQAYFYLLKAWGPPNIPYDDGKEAGAWGFKYKGYIIHIRFASWVEVMMFSDDRLYLRNYFNQDPENTRINRNLRKIVRLPKWYDPEQSDDKNVLFTRHFNEFFKGKDHFLSEIDGAKQVNEKGAEAWFEYYYDNMAKEHDLAKSTIDSKLYQEHLEKYGNENSKTRRALKVLKKVLKSFMTDAIWIRDVPHNIKGVMEDKRVNQHNRINLELT